MRTQLHEIVSQMAARRPDAPALTIKDETVTYAGLWDETRAFAAGLRAVGLGRGEPCSAPRRPAGPSSP
jgi:acyl-CoA synthetase (AMP-forming)/AMP-acid ligase II